MAQTKAKFAPDNEQGLHAYAVSTYSWGRTVTSIKYAENLAEAKRKFGWSGMRNTSVSIKRATIEDISPTSASNATTSETPTKTESAR